MQLSIGIDAGGSSTTLHSSSGIRAQGPASNWSSHSHSQIEATLRELLMPFPHIDSLAVCMAGLLTDQNVAELNQMVNSLATIDHLGVYPDYRAAWRACNDPQALCVISGTGSLVFDGKNKLSGGGFLLGDPGSAFACGQAALRRWITDGPSELDPLVEEHFGSIEAGEVLSALYQNARPVSLLARFAGQVVKLDSEVSSTLIRQTMQGLSELTLAHRRTFSGHQKVYASGGFWLASSRLKEEFEIALGEECFMPPFSNLEGALLLAEDLLK